MKKSDKNLLGMERIVCPNCGDPNASLTRYDMSVYCDRCHYFDRGMTPEEWYNKYYGPKQETQRTLGEFL